MAKVKTQYSCQNCGYITHKWLGKCPSCDGWSTFQEELPSSSASMIANENSLSFVRDQFRKQNLDSPHEETQDWHPLHSDQSHATAHKKERISTGILELDRVLGGGLVHDSFILLGGDPGIGKSTLLLQMTQGLIQTNPQLKIFYASGEESIDQIRNRALRLGIKSKNQIFLAAENQIEKIFAAVKELSPQVLIIDSLQTFASGFIPGAPGSVSQVREVAARLMTLAKTAGIAIWLVGHVTKEGNIAGPKTVEHMVDTVLYFEGEGGYSFRLLRTVKNRFGSTGELGVFEMEGEGLREVSNPSALFLSERKEAVPGTAVATSLEGSRPLLVELQALVAASGLAVPRRTSVGMDSSRISLLAAILEKHLKLPLAEQDLFFNVAGGLKMNEPACDLAAAAAIWSSAVNKPLPLGWVYLGELGLTGEVRKVAQIEMRLQEAARQGFSTALIPESTQAVILEKVNKNIKMKIIKISKIDQFKKIFGDL